MTSAARARKSAGLTPLQAAKRARVSKDYLLRLERTGGISFPLAQRLARAYNCRIDTFLSGNRTPNTTKGARSAA